MITTEGHFGLEIAGTIGEGLMVKIKAQDEGYIPNLEVCLDTLFAQAKAHVLSIVQATQ